MFNDENDRLCKEGNFNEYNSVEFLIFISDKPVQCFKNYSINKFIIYIYI